MRILRIIARLNIGGPAIHSILLTRGMQRLGYETLLVAGRVVPGEGDMTYLAETEGVEPIIIPQLGRKLRLSDDLVAFFRLLRLLFIFRPHIVHTHTAKAGTLGRMAAFVYNKAQSLKLPRGIAFGFHGAGKAQSWVRVIFQGRIDSAQSTIDNRQCKVVHTFHGHVLRGYFSPFKSRLFRGIEKILAKVTDAIVVVSKQQNEELCNHFGIGRPEQYRIIPLGFDLTPFGQHKGNKGTFRERLGFTESGIGLVGIIGRLTQIKNHRLFLEAVKLLTNSKVDNRIRFLIVGDGELRRYLGDLTHQLKLGDRVIFTGWIRDLVPLYADLDVLALTSDNEGTPVAVIEAMAAGVPVVATDVGGVRGLIGECAPVKKASRFTGQGVRNAGVFSSRQALCGTYRLRIADCGLRNVANAELTAKEGEFKVCERGVLVKPGDVKGFAKGLRYLLEHSDVRREMGQRGREYAMQRHSKERLMADMDHLYRSLLQ